MTYIKNFRDSLAATGLKQRSPTELDTIALDLSAHLIGSDPKLAEAMAAHITGDMTFEYRTDDLEWIASTFLAPRVGRADPATVIETMNKALELSRTLAMENPALIERLFAEVQ